jgi:hypothetical protein
MAMIVPFGRPSDWPFRLVGAEGFDPPTSESRASAPALKVEPQQECSKYLAQFAHEPSLRDSAPRDARGMPPTASGPVLLRIHTVHLRFQSRWIRLTYRPLA